MNASLFVSSLRSSSQCEEEAGIPEHLASRAQSVGHVSYNGNKINHTLADIDHSVKNWFTTGCQTRTRGETPIEWRNRELNFGVDTQCNKTVDDNKHTQMGTPRNQRNMVSAKEEIL